MNPLRLRLRSPAPVGRLPFALRQLVFAVASALAGTAVSQTPPAAAEAAAPAATTAADAPANGDPAVLQPITVSGQRDDGYIARDTSAATGLTLTPRETPQSLTVITRERLDDQQLDSLREVLDRTPGIYSTAYDTERVVFYSRGFLVDTLLIDGIPATTNFNTSSIDETLDTAFYERIEIVRGATGLMTGAGNPGAAVNLVRKRPQRSRELSAELTVGSWSRRRADVDASLPFTEDGSVRGRLVLGAEDRESFQALYEKQKYVAYGIVEADLAPSTRVAVGFDHQDNRPKSNTWGSFPLYLADGRLAQWPRSVTTSTDWAYWNRRTRTLFGELHHELGAGWQLDATLSERRYKEDMALFYVFGYPDPETGLGLDPYAYRARGETRERSLDLQAKGPFEAWGRRHELVLGANASRVNIDNSYNEVIGDLPPMGNFFEWDGRYPEPGFEAQAVPIAAIRTRQEGLYAVARLSLAEQLKLIAGARYARWRTDAADAFAARATWSDRIGRVIPYAGLIWDVAPQVSLFASYTDIFKPQDERGLDGRYLEPMEGRSFELGLKGEHLDGRLQTALTVFETRQDKVATPERDPVTGEPLLFPDNSTIMRTMDGTRTRGFELELGGELARNWHGTLGWTRYVMRVPEGETSRDFIPGTTLRLFTTWDPASWVEGLRLGAGLDWQSASNTWVGSPDGLVALHQGSVADVSLMARYRFNANVALQVNADNLLDRRYYVLDQYDNTYYGDPRKYTVTLSLSY